MVVLPKATIDLIERAMRNFLWSGHPLKKGKASVAWKEICKPRQHGGLGLKDLQTMNNALLLKLLWELSNKKDSLWLKWINGVYLKERSVWVYTPNKSTSPIIKAIMRLREEGQRCVNPRDGAWIADGEPFTTKATFQAISHFETRPTWSNIVWSKFTQPKCSFISWLALQGRLATKERIRSWGIEVDTCCLRCNHPLESTSHLFFGCPFSKEVWSRVCESLHWKLPHGWNDITTQAGTWRNSIIGLARKAAFCSTIYHIWKSRNEVMHDNIRKPVPTIVSSILFELKVRYSTICKPPKDHHSLRWCRRMSLL